MNALQELISPSQSQFLVLCTAIALSLLGAARGFRALGKRGLLAAFLGPLLLLLWQIHGVLTARFGLDSVPLLAAEIVGFIALGVVLGKIWNRIGACK